MGEALLGIGDIGSFCGLNSDAGYWYSSKKRLPDPDIVQGQRGFWYPATIEEWAKEHQVGKFKYL